MTVRKLCPECGEPIINIGAHLEECIGPVVATAVIEDGCGCPPGWQHERPCPLAYWPSGEAA